MSGASSSLSRGGGVAVWLRSKLTEAGLGRGGRDVWRSRGLTFPLSWVQKSSMGNRHGAASLLRRSGRDHRSLPQRVPFAHGHRATIDRLRQSARVPFLGPSTPRSLRFHGFRARSGGGLGGSREDPLGCPRRPLDLRRLSTLARRGGGEARRRLRAREALGVSPFRASGVTRAATMGPNVGVPWAVTLGPRLRRAHGCRGRGLGGTYVGPTWRRGSSAE